MGTPKLFILSEQMHGASFSLTNERYTLGRADDCDICISDPTISGHHCSLIRMENGKYAVQDNGSTNGTKVNQQPAESGVTIPLNNSDILQVGGVEILFEDIDGERIGDRTISVINLNNTGTGEFSKTAMKNLGANFGSQSTMLRENHKHNRIFSIVIAVLGVLAAAFVAYTIFFK